MGVTPSHGLDDLSLLERLEREIHTTVHLARAAQREMRVGHSDDAAAALRQLAEGQRNSLCYFNEACRRRLSIAHLHDQIRDLVAALEWLRQKLPGGNPWEN